LSDRLKSRASSSSLGSTASTTRGARTGTAVASASLRVMLSAVNIEAAPFQVLGQLLAGGPGIDGGGVQGFVAQQAGQFHQLARALAQVVECEGVPQRVGGDAYALNLRPLSQVKNDRLNSARRHRSATFT